MKGITDDSGFFTSEGEYAHADGTPERDSAKKKWDAYHDRKTAVLKEIKEKFEINTHCSGDDPVYFATIKIFSAWRGESLQIKFEDLTVSNERVKEFKKLCEFIGIPWKEPTWRLASYWG